MAVITSILPFKSLKNPGWTAGDRLTSDHDIVDKAHMIWVEMKI
jgi:hypothetical protein